MMDPQQTVLLDSVCEQDISQVRARALYRQQQWDRLVWSCLLLTGQWVAGLAVFLALLSQSIILFLVALTILAPVGIVWSLAGVVGMTGVAPGRKRLHVTVVVSSVLALLMNAGLVIWTSCITLDL